MRRWVKLHKEHLEEIRKAEERELVTEFKKEFRKMAKVDEDGILVYSPPVSIRVEPVEYPEDVKPGRRELLKPFPSEYDEKEEVLKKSSVI